MGRATALLPNHPADSRAEAAVAAAVVAAATRLVLDILSLAFIVLVVLVVGSAWPGLRSNWRSIQSMRSGQKAALDDAVFDLPEGPDCSHQHGHGPRCRASGW